MFVAVLFTIAKWWGHFKCQSMDEWINKMWYIYEYYLAIIRKGILTHVTTWLNLDDIMLIEISQSQKQKLYDSTYVRYLN